MEILIGVLASGLTETIKLLSPKLGVELSKKIIHGVVLGFCLVGTYLITTGLVSWEAVENYIQIFTAAYATYKLIVKPIQERLIS